ncbi:gamma-glutamylcyclotransferase family protein [Methylocaldum szegediense]|uniref:Putative gamma-glutamylcyclotransferase n=1 Tax=Methylocaldum szegediense TaxID=73780 RepID=A0ABN8XAY9_9GAMM|nr:gamma-glutamylcyclotransferase family protein [Methylocaldum szegediense]CAI8944216.1 Gamma-glutamyl AIG2-like cyclotransferase [Methylocaldum szegediense]
MFKVFAYGTLQLPDVMRAVTGDVFPSKPARLHDYARYCIRGRVYPGLRREPGSFTDGILYENVPPRALRALDAFEDDFYRRESLTVITSGEVPVDAEVYLVPPAHYRLLVRRSWDLDNFKETRLSEFLARCRRLKA